MEVRMPKITKGGKGWLREKPQNRNLPMRDWRQNDTSIDPIHCLDFTKLGGLSPILTKQSWIS